MKKIIAVLLAVMLLAFAAAPAMAAAPKIRKTEYEGNGIVGVDFNSERVRYKSAKVKVKDEAGKSHSATILEKDDDDITFRIDNPKAGAKYTFTISGVRVGKSGSYGSVKGSFRTPSYSAPEIEELDYDAEDRELDIDFTTRVQFKNLKVAVKDADGRAVTVQKIKKGKDDIEVKLRGVVPGETYSVTVSGVSVKGKDSYASVTGTFVAW